MGNIFTINDNNETVDYPPSFYRTKASGITRIFYDEKINSPTSYTNSPFTSIDSPVVLLQTYVASTQTAPIFQIAISNKAISKIRYENIATTPSTWTVWATTTGSCQSTTDFTANGNITATGNITAAGTGVFGNLTTAGNINATGNITASGTGVFGNLTTAGTGVFGNLTTAGNITAQNLNSFGSIQLTNDNKHKWSLSHPSVLDQKDQLSFNSYNLNGYFESNPFNLSSTQSNFNVPLALTNDIKHKWTIYHPSSDGGGLIKDQLMFYSYKPDGSFESNPCNLSSTQSNFNVPLKATQLCIGNTCLTEADLLNVKNNMVKYSDPIRIKNKTIGGGDGWQRYITSSGLTQYGDNNGIWRIKRESDGVQSVDG